MNKLGLISFVVAVTVCAHAQTANREIRPDIKRVLNASAAQGSLSRTNSDRPTRSLDQRGLRPRTIYKDSSKRVAGIERSDELFTTASISAGTSLSRVLHTSQLSLTSTAGTDEQFFDKDGDLIADDRTTLDSIGGSFDI